LVAVRRGVLVLHENFGRTRPDSDALPIGPDSLFPLASISKVIAATAILILVEDGLIGLNRPVQEYIPEFVGEGKDEVMIHHLLTHTSGWHGVDVAAHIEAKRSSVEAPACEQGQHPLLHEALWPAYDAPLSMPPGQEMSYTSRGYLLLGEILRRVSGMDLGAFATQRIFGPLGMTSTYYTVPDDARPRLVFYDPDWEDFLDRPDAGVGGWSTALDMAVFSQMFLNGGSFDEVQILSLASVREMTRNQIPGVSSTFKQDFAREASRGYGWDVKGAKKPRYHGSLDSEAAYTHQGAGGTSILVDPTYELVTVYFSVAQGIMSPEFYRPEWCMDSFTNMVTAAIVD
jgi:serine-type D-Ala-D-Ala carboxypeptidase